MQWEFPNIHIKGATRRTTLLEINGQFSHVCPAVLDPSLSPLVAIIVYFVAFFFLQHVITPLVFCFLKRQLFYDVFNLKVILIST